MKRRGECTPLFAELTAQEARVNAEKRIPHGVFNEIQYAMGLVDNAIDNGEFQCVCYLSISGQCIKILKERGYDVIKHIDPVTSFTSYEIKF